MTLDYQVRQKIVEEAKKWLGTPYHYMANKMGVGVDCAMILLEVYSAAGTMEWFDPRPYPLDWHLHNDEERYLNHIMPYAKELPEGAVPKAGDVVLVKMGRTFSHSAIIVDGPICIHAHMPERSVVYGDITKAPFNNRKLKFFTVFGDA